MAIGQRKPTKFDAQPIEVAPSVGAAPYNVPKRPVARPRISSGTEVGLTETPLIVGAVAVKAAMVAKITEI